MNDRRRRALLLAIPMFLLAMPAEPAPAGVDGDGPAGTPDGVDLELFDRLSLDLRDRWLDAAEGAAIAAALEDGSRRPAEILDEQVDRWLTRESLGRFVGAFLRFPNLAVIDPDAEPFFHRLSRFEDGQKAVYYLPHTVAARESPTPCGQEEREPVRAWWAAEPVEVCRASHRPEVIFDEIGYCSGEAEPLMRQPPRAGCGCGPLLMGCLPPEGSDPTLDALVRTSVLDEWYETAVRIVDEDRPLDELVTTATTWQTGLVEFLYLRREYLGELRRHGWSPGGQAEFAERLDRIDVRSPGRWVKRGGIYEGTGLWWTTMAPHALKIPVRPAAHHVLHRHLCSEFHALNVDAEAVLRAVGSDSDNLRTLSSITAAPMRFQDGCKGCHAPMDGAAGFLGEIQAAMYGSLVTGETAAGEFFVSGAGDFRGEGEGIAALAGFIVAAPEFETCSVRRAFEQVMRRPLRSRDQELFAREVERFRSNGHRWKPILKAFLTSNAYRQDALPTPAVAPDVEDREISAAIPNVIMFHCARCHDQTHSLDMRVPPPPDDVATWKKILARVSDYSMPPPPRKGSLAERFPLDPSVRRSFTEAVARMLGPAAEPWEPPRRMAHATWVRIVRGVASGAVEGSRVDALLRATAPERGVLAKLPVRGWPAPYALAVGRASEAVCREVARSPGGIGPTPREGAEPRARVRTVRDLLDRVYGRVAAAEATEALALLGELEQATGDRVEAWAALCSIHLSGPKLFFGPYRRTQEGGPPETVTTSIPATADSRTGEEAR